MPIVAVKIVASEFRPLCGRIAKENSDQMPFSSAAAINIQKNLHI